MIQKVSQVAQQAEHDFGGLMSYTAVITSGVAVWLGENWFLILSAIALLIRIGIDIPKLWAAWRKKDGKAE